MANSTNISNLNYFVALDDRVDMCSEVLDIGGTPTAADREKAADLKRVVFDGITTALGDINAVFEKARTRSEVL
jgi:hypothetical protein